MKSKISMKETLLSMFLCIVISGCGGPAHYWYKPETPIQQAETDCVQCYIDSMSQKMAYLHDAPREAEAMNRPYLSEIEKDFAEQNEAMDFNNCMKGRGYRQISSDFLDPALKTKFCSPFPQKSFLVAGQ